MRHPFENGTSILWLAALVAVLAGYLFLTLPSGPGHVIQSEAGSAQPQASEVPAHHQAAKARKNPPVPIAGFAIAVGVGVIALLFSLGSLTGAPARAKDVRWVGPRSTPS